MNFQTTPIQVSQVPADEFEIRWRRKYDAIFSGRDLDNSPFRDISWKIYAIGAPAYYFDSYKKPLTDEQRTHLYIYEAIGRCAAQFGDIEAIGALRGGPYLSPSIFNASKITAESICRMRSAAEAGFDMHVFAQSGSWGLGMSWDEEVAVIAGSPAFVKLMLEAVGGERVLRDDFERFSAYLKKVSDGNDQMVKRMLAQSGW